MTKKAVFLLGAPGSGKDFILRSSILKDLREVHLDKLQGLKLSDSFILVNCNADNVQAIEESVRLLEEKSYDTFGIFVYTTEEVSRQRNEQRKNKGSRVIDESLRHQKYETAKKAIPHYARSFAHFAIFDNSNDALTEDTQGLLKELQVEIANFILENAGSPGPAKITGSRTIDGRNNGQERGQVNKGKIDKTGSGESESKTGLSFTHETPIHEVNYGLGTSNKVHRRRLRHAIRKHKEYEKASIKEENAGPKSGVMAKVHARMRGKYEVKTGSGVKNVPGTLSSIGIMHAETYVNAEDNSRPKTPPNPFIKSPTLGAPPTVAKTQRQVGQTGPDALGGGMSNLADKASSRSWTPPTRALPPTTETDGRATQGQPQPMGEADGTMKPAPRKPIGPDKKMPSSLGAEQAIGTQFNASGGAVQEAVIRKNLSEKLSRRIANKSKRVKHVI